MKNFCAAALVPMTIKKSVMLLLEILIAISGSILLILLIRGGFAFNIGPFVLRAYTLKNPGIILISAVILRCALAGNFFQTIWLLALVKRVNEQNRTVWGEIMARFAHSPDFRKRFLSIVLLVVLITILIVGGDAQYGLKRGLKASYYDSIDSHGTAQMTLRDNVLSETIFQETFPDIVENYSIVWEGVLWASWSGKYQFMTKSDDGSELWIDDALVVDNGGMHGVQEQTGAIELSRGFHKISIRYVQGTGGAFLKLFWKRPHYKEFAPLSSAGLFDHDFQHVSNWAYTLKSLRMLALLLWHLVALAGVMGTGFHIIRAFPRWAAVIRAVSVGVLLIILFALVHVPFEKTFHNYHEVQIGLALAIVVAGAILGPGIIVSFLLICYNRLRNRGNATPPPPNIQALPRRSAGKRWGVVVFFTVYGLLGVFLFDDYGISFDETISWKAGMKNMAYMFHGDQQLLTDREKYHGPVFEILLVMVEKFLHLQEPRRIFLMRHFVTFLLSYAGGLAFYGLCYNRFHSRTLGVFGCLFLILSPRIFAHAFYNSKDLAFLPIFVCSMYTLDNYLRRKTIVSAGLHGLACGILIATRILGVFVPVLTVLLVVGDFVIYKYSRRQALNIIVTFGSYAIMAAGITILCWPILWEGPLYHFSEAFREMKSYQLWAGRVFYQGKKISGVSLPWHYAPVWLLITTPLLYTAAFFYGIWDYIGRLWQHPTRFYARLRETSDVMYLAWFFAPIFMVIVLKSVIYDGWRHLFFIYPAFVMIALQGSAKLYQQLKSRCGESGEKLLKRLCLLALIVGLAPVVVFMIRYHPYQNLYFNVLAGKDLRDIKSNFDLDYWGLSYRQAFQYILDHDPRERIRIKIANYDVDSVASIFPETDRERIVAEENLERADYFVGNYRMHARPYPYRHEYYALTIAGAKIVSVYTPPW